MSEHEQNSVITDLYKATCELQLKVIEISRDHGLPASALFDYVSRVVAEIGAECDVDHVDTSIKSIADARRFYTIRANNI